ncbi:AzlC family ABC transporter permease [Burkholderia glumae]|uniref:AzlC family ABC transporter permease n=2 Tax=Burkholderia glumae TaxID=337 RepID=A0AAP9Y0Y0_BURGL|nr:AzlC family ABC transporter permease [Burkholderia glumae]ACR30043.1 AzlC family protein [Burkholderia glumae BGR1]AJY66774.1 azlC family protein [Burkholderia glumae LMG 2196 = ATCC 33617]KHJ63303.1 branched-chain amino acid ABC transporter permease [Burkholderia glumae]MCM2482313.1 AzlC family ABC transporter permease [Burkholderia glumae]MCM2491079.1 AzlC family ABC transporter permease [Burkholderia glumae]
MLARLSPTDRHACLQAARDYAPTLTAILSWGFVTGIAMSQSVMTTGQAVWMSLLVYGGSSQLAVLPLMAAKLPLWTLLLTAAMVNLRFVIFSAGLAPHFCYLPMWRRILIGYFNGDVIYLIFVKQGFATGRVPGKEAYFWGMALLSWVSWQASSLAGIALASVVPASWGLGLAGTLALLPIMVSAVANRSTLAAVAVAGVVALLALDLPYRLGLPLAVFAALAAGTLADTFVERADWRRLRARVRSRDAVDPAAAASDGEGGRR